MAAIKSTHACPGGCGRHVPRHHYACRWCWYRLPIELRRGISGNYGRDRDAHFDAMAEAVEWYAEHPWPRQKGSV